MPSIKQITANTKHSIKDLLDTVQQALKRDWKIEDYSVLRDLCTILTNLHFYEEEKKNYIISYYKLNDNNEREWYTERVKGTRVFKEELPHVHLFYVSPANNPCQNTHCIYEATTGCITYSAQDGINAPQNRNEFLQQALEYLKEIPLERWQSAIKSLKEQLPKNILEVLKENVKRSANIRRPILTK